MICVVAGTLAVNVLARATNFVREMRGARRELRGFRKEAMFARGVTGELFGGLTGRAAGLARLACVAGAPAAFRGSQPAGAGLQRSAGQQTHSACGSGRCVTIALMRI